MGAPLEFISLIAALTGFAHLSKPSTWHREEDREIVLECLLRVHLRAEENLLGQGHPGQLTEKGQSVGYTCEDTSGSRVSREHCAKRKLPGHLPPSNTHLMVES